jgi:hypothetical protein
MSWFRAPSVDMLDLMRACGFDVGDRPNSPWT